jgi:Rod binding domain-containing protein
MDPVFAQMLTSKLGRNPTTERQKAERTAGEFEQLFVRTMVGSLRSTASLGGEEGGMFGSGPGADTFADWFDQNLAEQIATTSEVGIKKQLLGDLERHGEIPRDQLAAAKRAADRTFLGTAKTLGQGGLDVVLH